MKYLLSSKNGGQPRILSSVMLLLLAVLYTSTSSFALDGEKVKAIPSPDVDVILLTTPPENGFQPGDMVQIQIRVTNVDNISDAFRVDILDYPMSIRNGTLINSVDVVNGQDMLIFGSNAILREAVFNRGNFFRSCIYCYGRKITESYLVDVEFAEFSNAYTWIIDKRFRNGSLTLDNVATLTLTVELLSYSMMPEKLSTPVPVLTNNEFHFRVDYSQYDSYGMESLVVPVDLTDVTPETGVRTYTTVIAPADLLAGEPYLIEVGVLVFDVYGEFTYDLRLNQGFTSFASNNFYSNVFPYSVPSHQNGDPLNYRSLSFSSSKIGFLLYQQPPVKIADATEQFPYLPIRLGYLPIDEEYSIISMGYNCIYISSETDCDIGPIGLKGTSANRMFIQGVATLDMAGGNATLSGDISFQEYPSCEDEGIITQVCKDAVGTAGIPPVVFQIDEEIPIAAFAFSKMVNEPCFEMCDDGYFRIELTGADFRKVSSVWFVSDLVPDALKPFDIFQNFSIHTNSIMLEYGAIAKEPGGGFLYMFNNTTDQFSAIPTKAVDHVQTPNGNPVYDYGWYESIWFKMPFGVQSDATAGIFTNTARLHFMTSPFVNFTINKAVEGDVIHPISNAFVETERDYIHDFTQFYSTFFDLSLVEASVDVQIGCSVVSGYKFEDLDADGVRDANEPGLEGWEITLQGSAGTMTATTDASGYYVFPHVLIGNYQVRETQQEGWIQSHPAGEGFYNISLARKGSSATADFGNYRSAKVIGYKYEDKDGSGSFTDGEPMMVGVRVQLRDLSGNVVAEVLTDADGLFAFEGIKPGHYVVFEVIPDGMYQSQPSHAEGGFYHLVLTSGEEVGPYPFGNYFLTSLAGDVYYEGAAPPKVTLGDVTDSHFAAPGIVVTGIRTGPAPLKTASGASVVLPGQSSFEVVTDENGHFDVDGLLPGLYTVTAVEPAFTTSMTPNPLTEVLASGGDVIVEFGLYYDEYAAPELTKSSITGSVFADTNGDGRWQFPSESGVSGRAVTLSGHSKRGTAITRTTTTGSDGSYTFAELPEGRYVVTVQSAAGASISSPMAFRHVVVLGANEDIGARASGAPGGSGWLQAAMAGSDVTFGELLLILDTNGDGIADTRFDLSGQARFDLGGITGETVRPFALRSLAMYGKNASGQPLVAATPGLIDGSGELSGAGALVGGGIESGFVLSMGDLYMLTTEAIPFVGSADRWPVRNTRAVFNAMTAVDPVALRDVQGNVVAAILYAEHVPTFGADFAAERADFGDAPASYGTLRATLGDEFVLTTSGIVYPLDGARHLMPWTDMPGLMLGESVTDDLNGQPSEDASGDFDNGMTLPESVAPNATFEAAVNVTGTGLLSIWVDQDRNGVFGSSEKLVSDLSVETGEYTVTLHSGSIATTGVTFVRVRLTTQAGVGATGLALNGEVEDFMLAIDAALAGGGGGLPTSDDGDGAVPTSFALYQNYPNPFNPTTVIPYDLASTGRVRITVYDVTGRMVASLLDAQQNAGRHQVAFDAAGLPSGVYMVRLEAGGEVHTRKLTLIK